MASELTECSFVVFNDNSRDYLYECRGYSGRQVVNSIGHYCSTSESNRQTNILGNNISLSFCLDALSLCKQFPLVSQNKWHSISK